MRGLGISSLRQLGIMDALKAAIEDKTSADAREGEWGYRSILVYRECSSFGEGILRLRNPCHSCLPYSEGSLLALVPERQAAVPLPTTTTCTLLLCRLAAGVRVPE